VRVPTFAEPVVLESLRGASEPNIRASAEDHVFVTTTGTHLWRSADGGATFEAVGEPGCLLMLPIADCPPGAKTRRSGLEGGGDGSLALDAQGTLFWAGLFGRNDSIPFQRSTDDGLTWTKPFDLADGNSTDREWLAVGPEGQVYAVWRDSGKSDQPFPLSFLAESKPRLLFRASLDHGASWGPIVTVLEENLIDGPLAVDPADGTLYLPVGYFDGRPIDVLRSRDGGATWQAATVNSRAEDSPLSDNIGNIRQFIFPVAAVDDAGTVYLAWSEDRDAPPQLSSAGGKFAMDPHVYLSVSKDHGASWSEPRRMSPPDRPAVLPAIAAGAPGRVALGWYQAVLGAPGEVLPNQWVVTLAESTTADMDGATWVAGQVTPEPIHLGSICTQGTGCTAGDRSRGDFFEVALRANGLPVLAFVKDTIPPSDNGTRTDVVVARATDGTPLR
jgi:hypothetical protein